jgi:hypothetical protein
MDTQRATVSHPPNSNMPSSIVVGNGSVLQVTSVKEEKKKKELLDED